MKQCPTCKGIFDDDTLRYCLSDGSLLTTTYDSEATHIFTPPQRADVPPAGVVHDRPTPLPPPRQGVSPVVVYVLIAVLALVVGGGLVALLKPEATNHAPAPSSTATPRQESAKTENEEPQRKQTNREAANLSSSVPSPTPVQMPQQSATPPPPVVISESDLFYKNCVELEIMRNEIYARHGYIFTKNERMKAYFSRQPWYKPLSYDVSNRLSKTEEKTALIIKQIESRKGCR